MPSRGMVGANSTHAAKVVQAVRSARSAALRAAAVTAKASPSQPNNTQHNDTVDDHSKDAHESPGSLDDGHAVDYEGCEINRQLPGSSYVCLGPGKLCEGGIYVLGYGSDPVCDYPHNGSPFVLLILLILATILFENFKHITEHRVPHNYKVVVNALMSELATLGFVSLCAFMLERDWDGAHTSVMDRIGASLGIGHSLHEHFVYLHWLLFGISIAFIVFAYVILQVNLRQFRRYTKWSQQIIDAADSPHAKPRSGQVELEMKWLRPRSEAHDREMFMRLFDRFVYSWITILALVFVPWITFYTTQTHDPIVDPLGVHAQGGYIKTANITVVQQFEVHPNAEGASNGIHPPEAWIGAYHEADIQRGGYAYDVFWAWNVLLLTCVLTIDRKLHTILAAVVPLDPSPPPPPQARIKSA